MATKKITLSELHGLVKQIMEENDQRFGLLPNDLKNKEVFTKNDLKTILNELKKHVDESANYRIYDLERFLGIFDAY